MTKAIFLIAGYAAGGKTTFSNRLSEFLHIPVFQKDNIKACLGREIPIRDRAESKNLSRATFEVMEHLAEALMKTETPLILESNFVSTEAGRLQKLIHHYGYRCMSFVMTGDLHVIHQRFLKRDESPERGPANRLHGLLDDFSEFERAIKPLGDFHVGDPVVEIDATSFTSIDYDGYFHTARRFLAGGED